MSRNHSSARATHRHPPLRVELLEGRDVPAFLSGAEVAVGAGPGGPPLVQLIDPSTGVVQDQFLAFASNFYGGVRVAVGDVTGDGYPDLVVAAGPGGGPQVKVYDGQTGAVVSSFYAYDSGFTGGVNVAVGDVYGNGVNEIITGPGTVGGPEVNVFNGSTGAQLASFFAYDPVYRGGVRVAAGDLDGSGTDDIVTAPGVGGGPDVRTFRFPPGSGAPTLVGSFFAYDPSFTGGVYIATGDVTGGGTDEIITGAGIGGEPEVTVFGPSGTPFASFSAYDSSFTGGVRVAATDLTGNGISDVITGPGTGGGPQVDFYALPSTNPQASFWGLSADQTVGVSVAGSPQPINVPATSASVISEAYAQYQAAQAAQQATQSTESATHYYAAVDPYTFGTTLYDGVNTPVEYTPTGNDYYLY